MVPSPVFDVAVVGSGPAGAVLATLLARRGRSVCLIDKATFPRDKVCGDGLSPGTVRVLTDAGLAKVFAGEVPIHAVDIRGPDGARLAGELPSDGDVRYEGYVISRLDFDDRLFRAALAAGASDFTGHEFLGTELTAEGRLLRLSCATRGDLSVRAQLLVGADGAYSQVRRALGVPMAGARGSGLAMRAYGKTDAFDVGGSIGPRLLIEFGRELLPGYGWVFPTGTGAVNVGVGIAVRDLNRRDLRLRDLFDRYVELVEGRGLALGPLRGRRSHQLPQVGTMPRLTHPRAVLIGDAASMINPVSGEGIYYGVVAAANLAEHLGELAAAELADSAALDARLRAFEREFRRTFRWHFQSLAVAYQLLRHPRWASIVLTAAGRDETVLRDALAMLFGAGRIKASTTGRILLSGLRPAQAT